MAPISNRGASPAVRRRSIRSGVPRVMTGGRLVRDVKTAARHGYNIEVTAKATQIAHAAGKLAPIVQGPRRRR